MNEQTMTTMTKMTTKTYKVPVVWQMYGYVEVEADNVSKAIRMAFDAPLPEDGDYIEGSFDVDHDGLVEQVQ